MKKNRHSSSKKSSRIDASSELSPGKVSSKDVHSSSDRKCQSKDIESSVD